MKEIIIALIDNGVITGLIGILGVIIGWFLNFLSQQGRLNIHVKNGINAKFYKEGDVLSTSKEESKCFAYHISLDIYNTSNHTKIMRDIQVRFNSKKEIKVISTPYNDSKTLGNPPRYSAVGIINIPPKSAIHLDLSNYFWNDELSFIWDTTSVELTYKTNRRTRTKKIEKVDYSNYVFNGND